MPGRILISLINIPNIRVFFNFRDQLRCEKGYIYFTVIEVFWKIKMFPSCVASSHGLSTYEHENGGPIFSLFLEMRCSQLAC